jgi:hypothetical protein
LEDPYQVIVETSSMLLANLSDFFDDWVLPHEISLPESCLVVELGLRAGAQTRRSRAAAGSFALLPAPCAELRLDLQGDSFS